jgi:hypothetical protein
MKIGNGSVDSINKDTKPKNNRHWHIGKCAIPRKLISHLFFNCFNKNIKTVIKTYFNKHSNQHSVKGSNLSFPGLFIGSN